MQSIFSFREIMNRAETGEEDSPAPFFRDLTTVKNNAPNLLSDGDVNGAHRLLIKIKTSGQGQWLQTFCGEHARCWRGC